MSKNIFKIALIGFLAVLSSCHKDKPIFPAADKSSALTNDPVNMNLLEFAKSRGEGLEQDFLLNTAITDNTKCWSEVIKVGDQPNAKIVDDEKPKVIFKWHGLDPRTIGCIIPVGMCLIFGPQIMDKSEDIIPVSLESFNHKLWIGFPVDRKSNCGLTSDGYLPIPVDVDIPKALRKTLLLDEQEMKIRAGIYKANFDVKGNRFIGVTVDLK